MAPRARLRVIAGELGGRRLVAPAHIRPTTERVREALFARLGERVVGASVLDLYAGSGSLAIEALSRGAARAVLVDHDRAAADAERRNLEATGLTGRARVRAATVARALAGAPPPEAPFDLVVVDPPYVAAPDAVPRVLGSLARPGWLASDALVVIETPTAGSGVVAVAGEGFEVVDERRYGDTLLTTLAPNPT